jgi:hypothetical protein
MCVCVFPLTEFMITQIDANMHCHFSGTGTRPHRMSDAGHPKELTDAIKRLQDKDPTLVDLK